MLLNYKVQFKENKLFLGIIITRYVVRKQLKKTPRQLEESHIPALGWLLRCEGVHSPGSQEALEPRAWGPPGTPSACKGELRLCCLACNSEPGCEPTGRTLFPSGNFSWVEKYTSELGWTLHCHSLARKP